MRKILAMQTLTSSRWSTRAVLAVLLMAFFATACSVQPQPIHLGAEECSHCRMVISDLQFAGQALNTKGKAYNFDAIECMADWVLAGDVVAEADLHSLWVADFSAPETWVPVEEAHFLRSPALHSPMGAGLSAHASREAALELRTEVGGEVLSWQEVLRIVETEGGHDHHHHAHHHGSE